MIIGPWEDIIDQLVRGPPRQLGIGLWTVDICAVVALCLILFGGDRRGYNQRDLNS